MKRLLISTVCLLMLYLTGYSQEYLKDFCKWSEWEKIGNKIEFRYIGKQNPFKGTYQTWFEIKRTDPYPTNYDKEDNKYYAYAEITIEGYQKKIFIATNDSEEKRFEIGDFPFSVCNGIKFKKKTGYMSSSELETLTGYSKTAEEYCDDDSDYSTAIAINPNYARAYYRRAINKHEKKDYKGAITDLNLAIENFPEFWEAYDGRGDVNFILQNYTAAIADYSEVINIEKDKEAYLKRGNAKQFLNDNNGAIADYSKAININSEYAEAYFYRGYAKSEIKDYNGEMMDYSKAIEIDPKYSNAYEYRGVAKYRNKDYNGALADYSDAIYYNPQFIEAYINRGIVKIVLDQKSSACMDFNMAKKLGYEDADAYIKEYCKGIQTQTVYKTVKIGEQLWMAENLAINTGSGCWAYDNKQSNVAKYGYLYNWETAKSVCPTGWHLPSKEDFYSISSSSLYINLFPLGGWRDIEGNYHSIGKYDYFWSSTEYSWESESANCLEVFEVDDRYVESSDFSKKGNGFSVRCIKD